MYYRQPRYYNEFQCTGSECSSNCCYGWRIDWDKDEVEKVKNAPTISPELKELVERYFVPNKTYEGKFQIEFDERKKCPCVMEDGLCRIQKELGVGYLSHTCMNYPRSGIYTSNILYRFCRSSCPEIITKLLYQEKSMEIVNIQIKNDFIIYTQKPIKKENIKNNPALEYFDDIFNFFYELITDKKIPVETSIILGVLAAQKLTEIAAGKQYDRIPEALRSFRKQFHNPAQLKSIENIKPNYYLKLGFMSELMEKVIGNGATPFLHDQTGTLNIDLYNKGESGLREVLKGRKFFLRNLALNLLFEFSVPFKFEEKTIFENYSLFVAAFGLLKLKLNLIATCCSNNDIVMGVQGQEFVYHGDGKLIGMTAIICREICQSNNKAQAIISLLTDNKFTTPAYLALLVK